MFEKSKLYKAVVADDVEAARAIVRRKPKIVNLRIGDFGPRPLGVAIARNNRRMIDMLIEAGADVEASGYDTHSITGDIVHHGNLDLLRVWAERYPALITAVDEGRGSLLHVAASRGHADIVLYLLEYGIDPQITDHWGRMALHYAEKNGHAAVVALLKPLHEKALRQYKAAGNRLAPADENNWHVLGAERIGRVRDEQAIGYRVTEIFNFKSAERTRIWRNLETNAESVETRLFAAGDADVAAAHAALSKAGGTPLPLAGKTLALPMPEKRG